MKLFSIRFKLLALTVMFTLTSIVLQAAPPSWWTTRNVVNTNAVPNDFALIVQGQLKWMATNACLELEMRLPNGAGNNVWTLVRSLSNSNNYCLVNLGQLKYVAKPFYDQLIQAGYCTNYPWSGSTNAPNDYAFANIGQMKNVFSFDAGYSTLNDGIPDWWKLQYGLNPLDPNLANSDPYGTGVTILTSYLQGRDPTKGAMSDVNSQLNLNVFTPME